MRPFTLLSVLALTASVLSQPAEFKRHAGAVDVRGVPIKHNHRAHAHQTRGDRSSNSAGKLKKRVTGKKNKRCVAKGATTSSAAPTSTASASSTKSASHAAATTSAASSSNSSSSSGGGSSGGVVHINDSKCGANDPDATPGKGTGPNGKQDWFNCGLNSGSGWTPPMIKMEQLVFVPLADALKMKNNQFSSCKSLLPIFQSVAKKTGVPDILLASIAMQESSCNPKAFSAGSHGLFQLSSDLCKGYSDCFDPTSNTEGGANYINTLLKQFDGNIAEVMGNYNGWYKGIKPSMVQNMPCAMRQNWNYLQNIFNGFMQGIDGYSNGNVNDGCNGADNA